MYKIIKATKDTYIQNKWINNERQETSNVGLASSIDLYYLYNEASISSTLTGSAFSQSLKEMSRGLIYFDFSELSSSLFPYTDPSFKAKLVLKNIYGGNTTPTNFSISVNPLAKSFNEGIGFDVIEYRDIDACNWQTSSIDNGTPILWTVSGANSSGSIGTPNVDFYSNFQQDVDFTVGTEDLVADITPFVSAVLAGVVENNGFRLSLTSSIEDSTNTFFVKRFGSRHINKETLQPKVICLLDDSYFQNNEDLYFNFENKISIKNKKFGQYKNFVSNSIELTGSNCVTLNLIASRSVSYQTTSFSPSHSRSITYNTRSVIYYSKSFSGSQFVLNSKEITGSYLATVDIDYNDPDFINFHSNSLSEIYFKGYWKSNDGSVSFGQEENLKFKKDTTFIGGNLNEMNVLSILNFKHEYKKEQNVKFSCLLTNNSSEINKFSRINNSNILLSDNFFFRVVDSYTKEEIIPFTTESNATKISCDGNCMTFTLEMKNFISNKVYELEFMENISTNESTYYKNTGYRFKVL